MHKLSISGAAVAVTLGLAAAAGAHHSFAMFDLSQHRLVEGHVTDWHYNNPHSWLYIEALEFSGASHHTVKAFRSDLNVLGEWTEEGMPIGRFSTHD